MEKRKVGLALTGSFCTFDKTMAAAARLSTRYELRPIMSETAYATDTRFGRAADFRKMLEQFSGHEIIHTIPAAEPVGPQKLLDVLVIAPCTGNTLAKLANGITDTCVTMAAKAHLRNGRPLVIAVSTNDALSANAQNIGRLLARKNVYFVPFAQDDAQGKPCSLLADLDRLEETIEAALRGEQLQPIMG